MQFGHLNSDIWVSVISASDYYELVYDPITVHSSASATISFNGKSFTSDASGNTTKIIPWGTFTFSDSVSGQSYERTVDKSTTDLFVMPECAVYWYGNKCNTGGFTISYGSDYIESTNSFQINNRTIIDSVNSIDIQSGITLNWIRTVTSTNTSTVYFTTYKSTSWDMISSESLVSKGLSIFEYGDSYVGKKQVSSNYTTQENGSYITELCAGNSNSVTVYAIWLE